jgi:hypothetical protein
VTSTFRAAGWAALSLEDLPVADETEPGAIWYPIQHAFGFTAFGANAFVAAANGDVLVEEHDESGSGQEELYVVARGAAEFSLDGESVSAPAVFVVAVRDPSVRRGAVALEAGTTLLAFGGVPAADFRSTWLATHFEGVPRLL